MLGPHPFQPSDDPSSAPAFTSIQPTTTPSATLATEKGQEQPPLVAVMDVETDEVAEVGQLKRKKKDKEKEKEEMKENEAST